MTLAELVLDFIDRVPGRVPGRVPDVTGLHDKRPLVVGVHGPQGSGKSTLCAALEAELIRRGRKVAAVSIDDFYLTNRDQRALAAAHPGDSTLEHRGYPGTHDLALAEATLEALCSTQSGRVGVPVYDKSAFGGRGDRAPRERWREVETPLDLLLFDGWMLAFRATPEAETPALLRPSNRLLASYRWRERLDALVFLTTPDLEQIVRWRIDAERARRASGAPALSDAEAEDYVRRFLPAYELWTPTVSDPGVPMGERPPMMMETPMRARSGLRRSLRGILRSPAGSGSGATRSLAAVSPGVARMLTVELDAQRQPVGSALSGAP